MATIVKEPTRSERLTAGKCLYCPLRQEPRDAVVKDGKTLRHCEYHLLQNAVAPSKLRKMAPEAALALEAEWERAKAFVAAEANSNVSPAPPTDEPTEPTTVTEMLRLLKADRRSRGECVDGGFTGCGRPGALKADGTRASRCEYHLERERGYGKAERERKRASRATGPTASPQFSDVPSKTATPFKRNSAWKGAVPTSICWELLLDRWGSRCWGCTQERMNLLLVVAHLDPRNPKEGSGMRPGTDELDNLVLLCGGYQGSPNCNAQMRNDKTLDELREYNRGRGMTIDTSHFPDDRDRRDWATAEIIRYVRTTSLKEGRAAERAEIINKIRNGEDGE